MTSSADQLVGRARRVIGRIQPAELAAVAAAGGLIVDIRPAGQRAAEGALPGALVVERNELEWRLDPSGSHQLPEVTGFDQPVVVFCSEGYASSLAAESLHYLGYRRASDLAGGYQAWRAWMDGDRPAASEDSPGAVEAEQYHSSA
jgi:rhodanese-related sulfurtransferase